MADNQGWISLHRSIKDHWIYQEKRTFSKFEAWIDILLDVNHADNNLLFDGILIEVKRGQKITSIRQLSNKWGWSNTKVNSFLKLLEDEKMITKKSDTKKTLLTVVNYDKYQESDLEKRRQNDTENTPKRRRDDTETSQKHTNNNDNNDNNDNKESREPTLPKKKTKDPKHKYGEYQNVLLSDIDLEKLKNEFPNDWQQRIEKVSSYCASSGKSYKNYLATIRNWASKEQVQTNKQTSSNSMLETQRRIKELQGEI